MITVNCDIGERGADHPVDLELMNSIGMANIACGGHAGDQNSVEVFKSIALKKKISIAAHLSYPDKANFGRKTIPISIEKLKHSLSEQLALLSDCDQVKFHGALYNDCNVDETLAQEMADWLKINRIQKIVTPFDSQLAFFCKQKGISVVAEAFAERRYDFNPKKGQLTLVNRSKPYASIHTLSEAIEHARKIIQEQKVFAYVEKNDGSVQIEEKPIEAQTICIHSDSPIATDLAKALSKLCGEVQ